MNRRATNQRRFAAVAIFLFAVLVGAESSCRPGEREDDAFEPNDDVSQATPLSPGVAIEARINQGNADYYCLDVGDPGTVTFSFESRGLEDCSIYEVVAPDGTILHADHEVLCSSPRGADTTDRVAIEAPGGGSHTIRVTVDDAGLYCVGVRELGMADNLLPFSWDYSLVATTTTP